MRIEEWRSYFDDMDIYHIRQVVDAMRNLKHQAPLIFTRFGELDNILKIAVVIKERREAIPR